MSKSSAASVPKIPTQSAWSKGPPQSSSTAPTPRSQSPAPPNATPPTSATHSRRPSALGQAVSFKDGVAGARSPVNPVKSGSAVTFGSIDDVSAPISSSPASVPPIKTEGVKTFGTVPATPTATSAVNGKPSMSSFAAASTSKPAASSSSTPATTTTTGPAKMAKVDIKKLFQGSGSGPAPSPSTSQPPSDLSSPASRPSPLPSHSSPPSQPGHGQNGPHHQPLQYGSYTPFVPAGLRPQANGANGNGVPRSPVYPRQVPNGVPNGVNGRPGGPPGGQQPVQSPMSAGMPSPRMGHPHPAHPVPAGALSPGQPIPSWPGGYYYGGYPPEYMQYSPSWPMQHLPQQGQPPMGAPHPPHAGMPVSPRNPPPPLHAPGTPTMSPAVPHPHPHSTPSPHMHTSSLSSVSSPPSTPASSTGPGAARMDRNTLDGGAVPFIPRKVTIKTPLGQEIESFKRPQQPFTPSSPVVPSSPARRMPVRIETPEAKRKRVAEEEEKERAKKEEEAKVKKDAEDRERKQREEEERKKRKEEEDRARAKREAEEKVRLQKEAEEKERLRKEELEKERLRKEEEERQEKLRKEAEEKEKARLRKEEEERLQREAEEAERAKKEAEEKAKVEAEAAIVADVTEPEAQPPAAPTEDGEVEESADAERSAAAEDIKEKAADKASLRIDTSILNGEGLKRRPGPLDLSGAKPSSIVSAGPSVLANARHIDDFSVVNYPKGISSPIAENAPEAHKPFHYSRDFLLQFMPLCKEKPDNLPPLDILGLQPDQSYTIARGGSGNRRQPSISGSGSMGPPANAARAQAGMSGLGISGLSKSGGAFTMGQFSTPANKLSSDERFAMSSRSSSISGGPGGMPFGRPTPMVRSSSQGGPGGTGMGHRTRSKRGEKRGEGKTNTGPSGQSSQFNPPGGSGMSFGLMEPVAPLEVSANRWQPASTKKAPVVDQDSPEVVERKVKGLLNKLTMERFDSISDQIIAWANKSETEKDGRTLIQVIKLVFEKATDEAAWSEMYARLCRKMMERISAKVQDDGIRNNDGKPITGGHLFRKYLLNRCQEDFERGWAAKDAAQAAAATKATEDEAAAKAAEDKQDGEAALYSEEYYTAQKAKRQGLGLVKFIGELFKLQMLTERIMHECVKKLLHNVENPEEEEIESLCKLMTTVGALLDVQKARAHMDVYFQRMKELCKSQNVGSRMQFMLRDVIELRERKWIPRNQVAAPTTIAAVHEAAAKEKEKAAAENYNRTVSMSRGGSRRGADRGGEQVGPDGWAQVSGSGPRPPPKAGDLSQFGKIQKTTSMSFGPSDAFKKGKTQSQSQSRESTISRTNSTNAFSILGAESSELPAQTQRPSRPASRKPSVDLGAGSIPEAPMQRRKLNLLPRSVKPEEAKDTPAASSTNSEDENAEAGPSMSDAEVQQRIDEDSKEFFSIRDLEEAEVYFTKLPVEQRHRLVDKLVTVAIESKDTDSELVAKFFARAVSQNLCSPATFEEGFTPVAEMLDDLVYDSPKAFSLYVTMMKGAGLDKDEERRARLASKLADGDKLLSLLS